jgi:ABC-type spermidine/putrescine transport system permease subunit II
MTRTTSLPQPAISPKVQRRRPKWDRAAIIMIAPYLIFLVVFTAYPIFMAVYGSLSDWNILTGEMTFRGFQYYEKLLRDPVFFASLKNTLVYLMVQVPGSIIIGIFVAVLLNQRIRVRGVFRTIFFLPVVMPVVVLAIVWQWMYQERGVLNYLLSTTGMPSVSWLTSSDWSMLSIAIMKIWTDIGFYSVLFLAGLQTIPSEFTDAARVEILESQTASAQPHHRICNYDGHDLGYAAFRRAVPADRGRPPGQQPDSYPVPVRRGLCLQPSGLCQRYRCRHSSADSRDHAHPAPHC